MSQARAVRCDEPWRGRMRLRILVRAGSPVGLHVVSRVEGRAGGKPRRDSVLALRKGIRRVL